MNTSPPPTIDGTTDDAFGAVRDAFATNFERGDLGASCAVTHRGRLVVDLWGGHRDIARSRPWERDTIVNVWSTTKMMAALVILMLHDRGELSLDEPVASYWPEFADKGKGGVLIRHCMGHTAGLPSFEGDMDVHEQFDWDRCTARLASQEPWWEPGTASGYHANTQGWLLGELCRRVDGRTLGTFFREEVAEPLGVDFHIGTAADEDHRIAEVQTLGAESVHMVSEFRDRIPVAVENNAWLVNTTSWRRAEFPASNGHGNARSVARAMAVLANGGSLDGTRLLSPETIERIFEVQADGIDRVMGRGFRFGIGYGLNHPDTPLGTNERTCWWAGWGGSMCIVDVENEMTVAYVMNKMSDATTGDLRAALVIFAAHEAIAAL